MTVKGASQSPQGSIRPDEVPRGAMIVVHPAMRRTRRSLLDRLLHGGFSQRFDEIPFRSFEQDGVYHLSPIDYYCYLSAQNAPSIR